MEALLLLVLQYGLAALLGGGALKGGEYAVRRYKGRNGMGLMSPESCAVTHSKIDLRLDGIKEDLGEVKEVLSKIVDLQIDLINLKGELKENIHEEIDKHETRWHVPKAA